MENISTLIEELKRLQINSLIKREMLRNSALRKTDKKRNINIWSGVLALITGTLLSTVFGSFLNDQYLKIFASLLAFTSGILSLISTIRYTTEETARCFEGSNRYFDLSNKIDLAMNDPNITLENLFINYKEIKQEYVQQDEAYSAFDIYRYPKKRKWYNRSGDSQVSLLTNMKQYGYGYFPVQSTDPYEEIEPGQVPSHLQKFKYLKELVKTELDKFNSQAQKIKTHSSTNNENYE